MIEKMMTRLDKIEKIIIPYIENERYFLYVLGGLFLLGIVSKWIVVWNYNRMIKKAEDMDNPKNNILRQIKTKFESIRTVNGKVVNPMLLVRRYISRCRFGMLSFDLLDSMLSMCAMISVGIGGITGLILYVQGKGKTMAMAYILVGLYFSFAMIIIDKSIKTADRKDELIYIISDFFENSINIREQVMRRGNVGFLDEAEHIMDDEDVELEIKEKAIESKRDEEDPFEGQQKIINEVLSEYL